MKTRVPSIRGGIQRNLVATHHYKMYYIIIIIIVKRNLGNKFQWIWSNVWHQYIEAGIKWSPFGRRGTKNNLFFVYPHSDYRTALNPELLLDNTDLLVHGTDCIVGAATTEPSPRTPYPRLQRYIVMYVVMQLHDFRYARIFVLLQFSTLRSGYAYTNEWYMYIFHGLDYDSTWSVNIYFGLPDTNQ